MCNGMYFNHCVKVKSSQKWTEVQIKNMHQVGWVIYHPESIEVANDRVFILNNEGKRIAYALLDRCRFFHVTKIPFSEADIIPQLP